MRYARAGLARCLLAIQTKKNAASLGRRGKTLNVLYAVDGTHSVISMRCPPPGLTGLIKQRLSCANKLWGNAVSTGKHTGDA